MNDVEHLEADLLARLKAAVPDGTLIHTVANSKPNWVIDITSVGARIETEDSRLKGLPPQLVPAWMIQVAWDQLRTEGSLEQSVLLEKLNVKRSAAVVALLAKLPGVSVVTKPVTTLRYSP